MIPFFLFDSVALITIENEVGQLEGFLSNLLVENSLKFSILTKVLEEVFGGNILGQTFLNIAKLLLNTGVLNNGQLSANRYANGNSGKRQKFYFFPVVTNSGFRVLGPHNRQNKHFYFKNVTTADYEGLGLAYENERYVLISDDSDVKRNGSLLLGERIWSLARFLSYLVENSTNKKFFYRIYKQVISYREHGFSVLSRENLSKSGISQLN